MESACARGGSGTARTAVVARVVDIGGVGAIHTLRSRDVLVRQQLVRHLLHVASKVPPLDHRRWRTWALGYLGVVRRRELVKLGRGHRKLRPLIAHAVAQRTTELVLLKEAAVNIIKASHDFCDVDATAADDDGEAAPDGHALTHAHRLHDAQIARKRRVQAHGTGCESDDKKRGSDRRSRFRNL